MGCGAQETQEADVIAPEQQKIAETPNIDNIIDDDFDLEQDKKIRRSSHVMVDFKCKYKPMEFATIYLQKVNYSIDRTIKYSEYQELIQNEYNYAMAIDCGKLYQYIYYVKGQPPIQPPDLEYIGISCIQYIKFGYLFYRLYEIVRDVRKVLFYFLDDGFNKHVNLRNIRKLITLHYGLPKEKLNEVFQGINSRGGYIDYFKFIKVLDKMDRLKIKDDLKGMFLDWREKKFDPVPLDDVKSLDEGISQLEFSDISNKEGDIKFLKETV
ncbi:hypothetical protein SS50377_24392 [Spironucleus salmonicida]|uniref:EF-hand domain-containing protein n=1 Tax=Spironucleus salmonicida TaxID=348837 RepID=V6LP90_9EUKA|nr:hypothetical protein SS50377_24392 [Spironucleus salmonicida]|eukprot:EST46058.1 hypothetical protein SS50377_14048 [Spironucleus salmonicida]